MHKQHCAAGLTCGPTLTHSEDDPMDLLVTEKTRTRRALAAASWLALVIAFAGCTTKDVLEPCGPGGTCNPGFICNASNECAPVGDGAVSLDAEKPADARLDAPVSSVPDANVPTTDATVTSDVVSAPDVALSPVDAATPDLRVPDAAGTCGAEGQCSGAKAFCDLAAGLCVECLTSKQCTNANKPMCIGHTCTGCKNTTPEADGGALVTCKDLDPGKPVCNPDNGSCVECTADSQCGGATPLCIANKCQSCASASGQISCAKKDAKFPSCNADTGTCVECTSSSQCSGTTPLCVENKCQSCDKATGQITCAKKDAKSPSCNADNGACVECTSSSQCSGTTPLCVENKCQSCAKATNQITCANKDATHAVCDATGGACLECKPNTPVCDSAAMRLYQCDATGVRGSHVDCKWGCKDTKCLVAKRVFVSRGLYTANMGGLAGADNICNNEVLMGLAGAEPNPNFKAWLSDTVQSVADRFTHNDGPYVRTDGTIVARSWTDLTTKPLQNSISRDVTGDSVDDRSTGGCGVVSQVWSSTMTDASLVSGDVTCGNWTSDTGRTGMWANYRAVGTEWTALCMGDQGSSEAGCGSRNRIYCFEQ